MNFFIKEEGGRWRWARAQCGERWGGGWSAALPGASLQLECQQSTRNSKTTTVLLKLFDPAGDGAAGSDSLTDLELLKSHLHYQHNK